MTISTLLVSEAPERSSKLQALINGRAELSLIATVDRKTALKKIAEAKPRFVWVELDPDPQSAIKLLTEFRKKFPKVPFVASKSTLDAALTKSVYQLGALDFLDDQTGMDAQLAAVIPQLMQSQSAEPEPAQPAQPPAPKPDAKAMKGAAAGKKPTKDSFIKSGKQPAPAPQATPPAPIGDSKSSAQTSLSRNVVIEDTQSKFPLWIVSSLLTLILVTATYFLLRNPAQP